MVQIQINEYVLDEILEVLHRKFRGQSALRTDLFLLLGTGEVRFRALPNQVEAAAY